jgi:hypothetical protein
MGSARAVQVVRVVGGDHGNTVWKCLRLRPAATRPANENRPAAIRQHHIEAAPVAGVEGGDCLGTGGRGLMIERNQRKFASAALAQGRSEGTRTVQYGGDNARSVHPHPGSPGHTVPPGDGTQVFGPPSVRRIPRAVYPLVAIGGKQDKVRTDKDNDGTHMPNMACAEGKGQPPVVAILATRVKIVQPPGDPGRHG